MHVLPVTTATLWPGNDMNALQRGTDKKTRVQVLMWGASQAAQWQRICLFDP